MWSVLCKHKWEVIKEEVVPSELERILSAGFVPTGKIIRPMIHRSYITIVACKSCGKIKQFVNRE